MSLPGRDDLPDLIEIDMDSDDYGPQTLERDRLENLIMDIFRDFLRIIRQPNDNVTFSEAHAHFLHYIDDTVFLLSTRLLSGGGEVQLLPEDNIN